MNEWYDSISPYLYCNRYHMASVSHGLRVITDKFILFGWAIGGPSRLSLYGARFWIDKKVKKSMRQNYFVEKI